MRTKGAAQDASAQLVSEVRDFCFSELRAAGRGVVWRTTLRKSGRSPAMYIGVLRRRKWIVLVFALVVPVAAFFFSARQEALYQSSAEVYLNKQDIGSAITGIENQTLFANEDRAAETQVNLASVPTVAERALKIAGVKNLTADALRAESSVASKGASDILEFTVTDPDPRSAETLVNAYALAFTQYRGELDSASVKSVRKEVEQKLAELQAEGKDDSALYDNLVQTEQRLATLETLNTSRASVVRPADEAVQVAPSPVRNAILGLALGLVLGVALAFAIDALDTRVRSVGEIGERLGLPLLARVPPPPRKLAKGHDLAMMAQPMGAGAEAFRMLRTNLEFACMEREDMRVIMVASAVEQEGKSTTVANLALAEARSGRTCRAGRPRPAPAVHRSSLRPAACAGDHGCRARKRRARGRASSHRPQDWGGRPDRPRDDATRNAGERRGSLDVLTTRAAAAGSRRVRGHQALGRDPRPAKSDIRPGDPGHVAPPTCGRRDDAVGSCGCDSLGDAAEPDAPANRWTS